MLKVKIYIVILLINLIGTSLSAQSVTAYDIMKKNKDMLRVDNEKVTLKMELINKKGNKRTREINQYSMTSQEDNRSTLLRFNSPADVKGIGFLAIENTGRENDQWLYLPALGRSRRISASDDTDNFMGSDFTYEDIGTEEIEEFNYKLKGSENINGFDSYLIEAIPNSEQKQSESGYSKREIYVDKSSYLVVQTKYFNKKGELSKIYTGENVYKVNNTDKWRVHVMTMKNLKTEHTTVLYFDNYNINAAAQNSVFTQRYLESGK